MGAVMQVTRCDVRIAAPDGFPLAATLYEPAALVEPAAQAARGGGPVVIVGAATAVPRRFYAAFATFLAAAGATVLTFDYRGVGDSRPASLVGFPARMRDWGILDSAGLLAWVASRYPGASVRWVGHSYGGFGPGLAPNNAVIDRLLAVSSMSADWRLMRAPERYRVAVLMAAVLPATAHLLGYFPGRINGAEDLPKGVLLEWARWCTTRDFLFGDDSLPERRHFGSLAARVRLARAEDDPWASAASVDHLAARFHAASETSIWDIRRADVGGRRIGHVGFFRAEFAPTLWVEARDWLLG
jgi:predicted alpha/beta hydrolase